MRQIRRRGGDQRRKRWMVGEMVWGQQHRQTNTQQHFRSLRYDDDPHCPSPSIVIVLPSTVYHPSTVHSIRSIPPHLTLFFCSFTQAPDHNLISYTVTSFPTDQCAPAPSHHHSAPALYPDHCTITLTLALTHLYHSFRSLTHTCALFPGHFHFNLH